MEHRKRRMLLRCVSYGFVIMLIAGIITGGYVYIVIGELQLKISQNKIERQALELSASRLEKDSLVLKQDLETYLMFAANGNLSVNDMISNEVLQVEYDQLRVLEDVNLPALEKNSCSKFQCIQFEKDFPRIPSTIWKGLLGTEDFRFLEHRGVDPLAIARAIIVDVIAMKFIQGGSTLTQQLMKNLFLSNERKISRKLKEMIYALYIENVMSKEEIVTLYLNEMFWGVHQNLYIKGFHAASLAYFNKAPSKLDEFEATILISLLKGPNFYNPAKGIERLKDRSTAVFKRLQGLSLVPKDDRLLWSDARWDNYQKDYAKRNKQKTLYQYFLLSKNSDVFLEPFEKLVLFGSYLTHNKSIQERLGVDADYATKILVGKRECDSYDCAGVFSFYSKIEREKRRAITEEFHQVGSLFKPMVYDTFIDLGRSYQDIVSTEPITLKLKSGIWKPKDYSKARVDEVSLKEALQKSKNIPLIRVASEVGFEKVEEKLLPQIPRLKTPLAEFPAQLLGALELSLEEVFLSYRNFLNNKCQQIEQTDLKFEESLLFYMSVASETTISRVVRPPLSHALVFGKTGTSNNGLDNWYFAFDGRQLYVFWFGVESERDKTNLRISGASTAFRMFQDFINYRGKQVSEVYCQTND